MTESDSLVLTGSEVEAKRLGENKRLKEELEQLRQENIQLKSQFSDAIQITEQVEELHNQNANLLAQLRDLKSENADLHQRIEIFTEKDKETKKKIAQERNATSSQRGSDLNSMNKEIEKIKEQSRAQIDSIYKQLDEANQRAENEQLEKKLLIRKLDDVMADAGRFFDTEFNTIDEVLNSFKQNRSMGQSTILSQNNTTMGQSAIQSRSFQQGQVSMSAQQQQQQKNEQEAMKKKLKKLKKQVNQKEEELNEAQGSNEKLARDLEKSKKEYEDRLQDANLQLQQLQLQMQRENDQYSNNLRAYDAKITQLKKEIESQKEKCQKANEERKQLKRQLARNGGYIGAPQQSVSSQPRNGSDSESGSNDDSSPPPRPHQQQHFSQDYITPNDGPVNIYQEKVELTEKLSQANRKKEQLAQLLQQKDQRYHDLEIEMDKIRNQNEALKVTNQEQGNELQVLRDALITREEAKEKSREIEPKEKPEDPKVAKLQKYLQSQKEKYYQLKCQSDKKDTKIQDLELDAKHLTQRLQDAEEDVRRAQQELKDLKQKNDRRNIPEEQRKEEAIPPSAFRCSEFPPELSSKVAKIANNSNLQPDSKIQNTYKVIRKYYMHEVSSRDAALDEAWTENQQISSAMNQFLVDASIALDDNPITFKDFFEQNSGKDLVEKVQQLRSDNSNLIHENEQMKATLSQLRETFIEVGDGQDPVTHIMQIRDTLDATQQDLQKTSKKMKSYKSQLKKTEQQSKKTEQSLKQQIDDLEAEKLTLSRHREVATKQIQDLKEENQRLTVELSDVTHTRDDLESTIIQEHDEQIQQQTSKLQGTVEKLKSQLRSNKQQYKSLESEYHACNEELQRMGQQLNQLRSLQAQREIECKEMQRQAEENEKALADRFDKDKESLQESFKETLHKLHEQCEKHREDVKQLNQRIADSDIATSNLKAQNAKLLKEKLRAVNEMTQMREELKRNTQLVEQTIRSNKATAECNYNKSLEEYKNKIDNEKRALYAYAADSFREYYDPGSKLNESSYKSLLDEVHEIIDKLQKTDTKIRNMVGATNGQTTEDAVAHLLMS